MSRTLVAGFATELKIAVEDSWSLVDLLWAVVKKTLLLDDDDVLRVLHRRIARINDMRPQSEALLEVEEAVEAAASGTRVLAEHLCRDGGVSLGLPLFVRLRSAAVFGCMRLVSAALCCDRLCSLTFCLEGSLKQAGR